MHSSNAEPEVLATDLRFVRVAGQLYLRIMLRDGRRHESPLDFYPTLLAASPAMRRQWRLIGRGDGFHWEALDLDLSVSGILSGVREKGRSTWAGSSDRPRPKAVASRRSPPKQSKGIRSLRGPNPGLDKPAFGASPVRPPRSLASRSRRAAR